jgi:hypothetical protein
VADLYFDNDVSVHLAALLRDAGHTVTLTRDLRRTRAFDEQQLITALELDANLVTHNYRDFLLLHRAWELWRSRWHVTELHPGILVLPQGAPQLLANHLAVLLESGLPARSSLYRYRGSTGWVRHP